MQIRVNVITVPVDQIDPNPWNPNVQTQFMYGKELESIREFGFVDPVTGRRKADGRYEIIDGEHRWKAAKEIGIPALPFNDIGEIGDAKAKKLTLVMNELKGKPDNEMLGALLGEIKDELGEDEFKQALPYTDADLGALMADDRIDWEQSEKPGGDERGGTDPEKGDWKVVTLQLPKDVAMRFKEQVERVKKILHPGEDAARTSPIVAVQVITKLLAESPDTAFTQA